MERLRTRADIAHLWTCPGFIPAVHLIYGSTHEEQAAKFDRIADYGALLPARDVSSQNMFGLDRLAGDDAYVFLSAGQPAKGLHGGTDFGFVFDAVDLVRNGAVLGEEDLLHSYEGTVRSTLAQYFGQDSASGLTGILRQAGEIDQEAIVKALGYANRWLEQRLSLDDFWSLVNQALESVAATRLHGRAAQQALGQWAKQACRDARRLIQMAGREVEAGSDRFQNWYRDRIRLREGRENAYDMCVAAARNTVAADKLYLNVSLRSPPELLWPGPLEVARAVAVIELPASKDGGRRNYTGFYFPDDLFTASCPADFEPAWAAENLHGRADRRPRRQLAGSQPRSLDTLRALRFTT